MKLEGSRFIAAPRANVWAAINDPDVLRRCIPGCESMTKSSPTEFAAVVKQRIGPVAAKFQGNVVLSDIVEGQSVRLTGEGKGGVAGMAKGGALVSLTDENGGTRLDYDGSASVGGKLAQLGSRLISGVTQKMTDQFFANFSGIVETGVGTSSGGGAATSVGSTQISGVVGAGAGNVSGGLVGPGTTGVQSGVVHAGGAAGEGGSSSDGMPGSAGGGIFAAGAGVAAAGASTVLSGSVKNVDADISAPSISGTSYSTANTDGIETAPITSTQGATGPVSISATNGSGLEPDALAIDPGSSVAGVGEATETYYSAPDAPKRGGAKIGASQTSSGMTASSAGSLEPDLGDIDVSSADGDDAASRLFGCCFGFA